ncbi:MAG: Crp/Fnr family transcriptional regulator [Dehalobacter sp. 4CP]|uniref:Crp/Fnr family transcriptional regulator n=1 Tax=Dehalobacter sp. CP TaxID=2594474 RepID=UPI0013CDC816|nr:Crp/Fnr family transcriptional regulator [Dehalobacter sp. 4CP]
MKEFRIENVTQILKFENASEKLLNLGENFFLTKNSILVSPGYVPNGLYYVKDGRVKASTYSPNGNENIRGLQEKGSIFLEHNILFNIPTDCYFMTIEDSNILFIKKEDLLNLLKADFDVMLFITQSITCKFMVTNHLLNELLVYDSEWRICRLLLTFADSFGMEIENKIKLNLKISQQFISDMLGVNRATTIRAIKKLKEMNLIEQTNGYYFIKDLQQLKKYQTELRVK